MTTEQKLRRYHKLLINRKAINKMISDLEKEIKEEVEVGEHLIDEFIVSVYTKTMISVEKMNDISVEEVV